MDQFRIEKDSMGEVKVPNEKYWGAQTERSYENFKIGIEKMPVQIVRAFALLKGACAEANRAFGKLDDRRADAAMRVLFVLRAQTDADEHAAAVADHRGDGQRNHRQRENDGVGRVAVGAEIIRVGDENLIDDVVQRADEQRNDARQREPAREAADFFRAEEGVGLRFHLFLSFQQSKKHMPPCGMC